MNTTVTLGRQGRLVIPAEVRAALGLTPGDVLHLRVDHGALVLRRPADAAAQLRGLASRLAPDRDLVAELLAERRAEAKGEAPG